MTASDEKVTELESKCKHLEESKFESEKALIESRELVQKLESKKAELEAELHRTEDALEKVIVITLLVLFPANIF